MKTRKSTWNEKKKKWKGLKDKHQAEMNSGGFHLNLSNWVSFLISSNI